MSSRLRKAYVAAKFYELAHPLGQGAPKRSGGGLLIRVPYGLNRSQIRITRLICIPYYSTQNKQFSLIAARPVIALSAIE